MEQEHSQLSVNQTYKYSMYRWAYREELKHLDPTLINSFINFLFKLDHNPSNLLEGMTEQYPVRDLSNFSFPVRQSLAEIVQEMFGPYDTTFEWNRT